MSKPPLQLLLVFHPRSDPARELARDVHRALNENADVPGLRVPTCFCPQDGDVPPKMPDVREAELSFVVVLADADTRGRDDRVQLQSRFESLAQLLGIIARDPQVDGLGARGAQLRE